jgi:hypothetical protein
LVIATLTNVNVAGAVSIAVGAVPIPKLSKVVVKSNIPSLYVTIALGVPVNVSVADVPSQTDVVEAEIVANGTFTVNTALVPVIDPGHGGVLLVATLVKR